VPAGTVAAGNDWVPARQILCTGREIERSGASEVETFGSGQWQNRACETQRTRGLDGTMLNVSEAADVCGLGTEGGQGEMFCVEFGTGSWNWIKRKRQVRSATGFWQAFGRLLSTSRASVEARRSPLLLLLLSGDRRVEPLVSMAMMNTDGS